MNIKVIRNEADYEAAVKQLESLMSSEPGSPEADLLEVLSVLIERYEEEHFPVPMPDPIEAIKFRMDQKGLKQKDLIPFIGSKGNVSDVLNRRRSLSLSMIRALHKGLGIPYEILMQDPDAVYQEQEYFIDQFPFREMVREGYFPGYDEVRKARLMGEELLNKLMDTIKAQLKQPLLCKHGMQEVNPFALNAWRARVSAVVLEEELPHFDPENLNQDFLEELRSFNQYRNGVLLAEELLNKIGIHFVILKNLPGTYLDGASFFAPDGSPVIGLTLRHDRLDNFWFTIFHELGHLKLHLSQGVEAVFFDDTNQDGEDHQDPYEIEANRFARNLIIPDDYWETNILPTLSNINNVDIITHAKQLGIHPALVAGQVRWAKQDFVNFSELIGYGEVRVLFQKGGEA